MDENTVIDEVIKNGFNLGYRLAATAEGRKKAVELVKGKEDLPISQAIAAGVKQAMADDLQQSLTEIEERAKKRGLRR